MPGWSMPAFSPKAGIGALFIGPKRRAGILRDRGEPSGQHPFPQEVPHCIHQSSVGVGHPWTFTSRVLRTAAKQVSLSFGTLI